MARIAQRHTLVSSVARTAIAKSAASFAPCRRLAQFGAVSERAYIVQCSGTARRRRAHTGDSSSHGYQRRKQQTRPQAGARRRQALGRAAWPPTMSVARSIRSAAPPCATQRSPIKSKIGARTVGDSPLFAESAAKRGTVPLSADGSRNRSKTQNRGRRKREFPRTTAAFRSLAGHFAVGRARNRAAKCRTKNPQNRREKRTLARPRRAAPAVLANRASQNHPPSSEKTQNPSRKWPPPLEKSPQNTQNRVSLATRRNSQANAVRSRLFTAHRRPQSPIYGASPRSGHRPGRQGPPSPPEPRSRGFSLVRLVSHRAVISASARCGCIFCRRRR